MGNNAELQEAVLEKYPDLQGHPFKIQYFDKDFDMFIDIDDELPPGSQLRVELLHDVLVKETEDCDGTGSETQFDGMIFETPGSSGPGDKLFLGEPRPAGFSTAATQPRPGSGSSTAATQPRPLSGSSTAATQLRPAGSSTAATQPRPGSGSSTAATQPPPAGYSTAATQPRPAGSSNAATQPRPGSGSSTAATQPRPGSGYSTAATQPRPGSGSSTAATQPRPGSGYSTAATQPRPGESSSSRRPVGDDPVAEDGEAETGR